MACARRLKVYRAPVRSDRQRLHSPADLFVGNGFRYWLTGLRTGDLSYWERAFTLAANAVGPRRARAVCCDFSQWVRLLNEQSRRDLEILSPGSTGFCRDECVAMALVAAHQHQACPALQACAMTLLECEPGGDLQAVSGSLADRLKDADQILSKAAMDNLVRYATAEAHLMI